MASTGTPRARSPSRTTAHVTTAINDAKRVREWCRRARTASWRPPYRGGRPRTSSRNRRSLRQGPAHRTWIYHIRVGTDRTRAPNLVETTYAAGGNLRARPIAPCPGQIRTEQQPLHPATPTQALMRPGKREDSRRPAKIAASLLTAMVDDHYAVPPQWRGPQGRRQPIVRAPGPAPTTMRSSTVDVSPCRFRTEPDPALRTFLPTPERHMSRLRYLPPRTIAMAFTWL